VTLPLDDGLVAQSWAAALSDAGLDADAVGFWPCEGFAETRDDAPACSFPADCSFDDERFEPALGRAGYDLAEEMRPRVALFTDFFDPEQESLTLLDGVMRHELEHVRQFNFWDERGVNLFDLDGVLDWLINRPRRIASELYNCKPVEQDANAAASRYLWQRYPYDELQRIHSGGRYGELVRYRAAPAEPETLVQRMVSFCLLLPAAAAEWEDIYKTPFARELDRYAPGAGTLWDRLKTSLTET
jgi:hypothetical protein